LPSAWNDDPPGSDALILRNIVALGTAIQTEARARPAPNVARAQAWHRAIYDGVALPEPYFAGEIRDSDTAFPELYGYEVRVGPHLGVLSADVPTELARLEDRIQRACRTLDAVVPAGEKASASADLDAVIALCANVHGEWVRIHPFANGNGRTARVWANWLAARYGLPPFVQIRPRPANLVYGLGAQASMTGDHRLCAVLFGQMLNVQLSRPATE
jgi:Fic family protein